MQYDPLYVQFLYYFNIEEDYYECHEVMEHLWLEEGRSPLYQGMLQVAVGLHHHQNNNISGAIKLFSAGIQKLKQYPEVVDQLGIDLQELIHLSENYVQGLEQSGEQWVFRPFKITVTDPTLDKHIEELRLDPPHPHV